MAFNAQQYDTDYKSESRQSERDLANKIKPPTKAILKEREELLSLPADEFLIKCFPLAFYFPFTKYQLTRIKAIEQAIIYGGSQAIAADRSSGKTTITEGMAIHGILKGVVSYLFIVACNGPKAIALLRDVKGMITDSELLGRLYPEMVVPAEIAAKSPQKAAALIYNGNNIEFEWKQNKIKFPDIKTLPFAGFIIEAHGIDYGGIRGTKEDNRRPDFCLIDDPETEQSHKSETEVESRSKTIDNSIGGLGGRDKKIGVLILCTIQSEGCLADKYTDVNCKPAYGGIRQKAVIEWPNNIQLWDEYIEIRQENQKKGDKTGKKATSFYRKNRKKMDFSSEMANKNAYDRRTEISALQSIYNIISDHGMPMVLTEYQNEPPKKECDDEMVITSTLVMGKLNGVDRGIVPVWCEKLVIGIDIGGRIIHWSACAVAKGMKSAVVDYGTKAVHSPSGDLRKDENQAGLEQALWEALLELANQFIDGFPIADGLGMKIPDLIGVDAGYMEDVIYRVCIAQAGSRWVPLMGVPGGKMVRKSSTVIVGDGWWRKRQNCGVWLYSVDADKWKRSVQTGFLIADDINGNIRLFGKNKYDHKDFSNSMVSEKWEITHKNGRDIGGYRVIDRKINHHLDTMQYCRALASILGLSVLPVTSPPPKPKPQLRKPGGFLDSMPGVKL